MNKVQITLTIDEFSFNKLQAIADKTFEGNKSMAIRALIRHSQPLT